MRLLLDSSIWPRTVDHLRAGGHDVVWAGDWPRDPGDEAILATAHRERRILVTLDKDFGELAVRHGRPHAGIVRLVAIPVADQAWLVERVLTRRATGLANGAIVTADPERIRVRPSGG